MNISCSNVSFWWKYICLTPITYSELARSVLVIFGNYVVRNAMRSSCTWADPEAVSGRSKFYVESMPRRFRVVLTRLWRGGRRRILTSEFIVVCILEGDSNTDCLLRLGSI